MPRFKITLSFKADVKDEDQAWGIADALEQAALRKSYRAIQSFVEPEDARSGLLGNEEAPPMSSAETIELRDPGSTPMSIGIEGESITIGGEDGRQG